MSKTVRKQISKKIRFEVFKRDSFKCQYCGKSAPDVKLHVDHIKTVSKGGDNSILNLVTACEGCNLGKSNIELSDDSAVMKQKAQLDELNERREQLQMMIEWRDAIKELDSDIVNLLTKEINDYTKPNPLTDAGKKILHKWFKSFGYILLSESIEHSANVYLDGGLIGECSREQAIKFFNMIPKIAANIKKYGKGNIKNNVYYIRGVLRNRLHYINEKDVLDLLTEANKFVGTEHLLGIAKEVKNWTEFKEEIQKIVENKSEQVKEDL